MGRSLTDTEIETIIAGLYVTYTVPGREMTIEREQLLRYALSKVGCEYNQSYHSSLTRDIFDCSSFSYRSYREIGVDISMDGIYTAALQCFAMDNKGLTISESDLLPGDLIYYSTYKNGRYRNITHVAIYVGNGKAVEARNTRKGVCYGDFRSADVVAVARPLV